MRLIAPFKLANTLTYCTKCWKLGHIRYECIVPTQKCKIYLLNYDSNHNNESSKQLKCVQCHQDHHSLDPNCLKLHEHQRNLNQAVKEATERGRIKRNALHEEEQPTTRVPNLCDELAFQSLMSHPINTTTSIVNHMEKQLSFLDTYHAR